MPRPSIYRRSLVCTAALCAAMALTGAHADSNTQPVNLLVGFPPGGNVDSVARNLAAGMSGGIAFVLGLDPARVNTEMVQLQQLEAEDLAWLHDVVAAHVRHTGSTLASSILADWPRRSAQFTKVMPTDYQRVLQATRMAKAEGRDVDSAIMEASRG